MSFLDNLLPRQSNSAQLAVQPKPNSISNNIGGAINKAISSATQFFPSVKNYVVREAGKAQQAMQQATQTMVQNWQQKPSNTWGNQIFNKLPTTPERQEQINVDLETMLGKGSVPTTIAQGFNNWFSAPLYQIPYNVKNTIDPNNGASKLERVGSAAQAGFGLLPGADDMLFAGLNALKNMAAKRNLSGLQPGLAGTEYAGLGSAVTGGKDTDLARNLNLAEIPLLLLAGGLKGVKGKKQLKTLENILEAEKQAKTKINRPTPFVDALDDYKNVGTVDNLHEIDPKTGKVVAKVPEVKPLKGVKEVKPKFDRGIDANIYRKEIEDFRNRGYSEEQIDDFLRVNRESNYVPKPVNEGKEPLPGFYNTKPKTNKLITEVLQSNKSVINTPPKEDEGYFESLMTGNKPKEKYDLMKDLEIRSKRALKESLAKKKGKPIEEVLSGTKQTVNDVDYDNLRFEDKVFKADTPERLKKLNDEVITRSRKIVEIFKKRKTNIQEVAQNLEAGKVDENTDLLKRWFDLFKSKAESDGIEIPTRKDFFTHISTKNAEDIIVNGAKPDTFGSITGKPYFAEKRTGKLKEYNMDEKALQAYAIEALKNANLTPAKKLELKTATEIVKEVQETVEDGLKGGKTLEITRKIQALADPDTPKTVYSAGIGQSEPSKTFRSVDDRTALVKDTKFYDNFLYPFKKMQIELSAYGKKLEKMTDEELKRFFNMEDGQTMTREQMLGDLLLSKEKGLKQVAVDTFKENLKNAEFKQNWLASLTDDIFDEYVAKDIRIKSLANKMMGQIRAFTGRGLLGFNVSSAINNIFEIRRGIASIGTKEFTKAIKRVISGEDITAKYGVDSVYSTALERVKNNGTLDKVFKEGDKALFYMFDKTEKLKDKIMLAGFEEQGIAKGLKGEELTKYVLKKYSQFAIKYGKGQDIGMFKSPLAKTVLQFAQYSVKDLIITADKFKGASKGDIGDIKYLAKYGATTFAQAMLFKAVLGQIGFGGQTGTSFDLLSNITDTGTEGNRKIPLTSPVVQAFTTLAQMISDEVTGTERDEYITDKRNEAFGRNLTNFVPGSNQLYWKTGKAYLNQQKGYQEKYGGNVANPVSSDPFNIGKTLLFGSSYDPKRQQYGKDYTANQAAGGKGTVGLNKNQSILFKQKPREEQVAFYDQQVALNKKTDTNKELIASMGKEPKRKGVIGRTVDAILNKQPEKKSISWMETAGEPKTYQEKKDHQALVYAAVNAGEPVPDKDIHYVYLDGKKANDQDISVREDVYKKLKSTFDNEDLSDELKAQVLKVSGANEKQFEYYKLASESQNTRLQKLVPALEKMSKKDVMTTLALNKVSIAGQAMVDSSTTDYLYNKGILSKSEKKFLDNLKFDELSNQFFLDRDYKGSGTGMTPKQVFNLLKSMKSPASILKSSKTELKDILSRNKVKAPSVVDILGNSPKFTSKLSGKDLWFKV